MGIQIGCNYDKYIDVNLGINYLHSKERSYTKESIRLDSNSTREHSYIESKTSIMSQGFNFNIHGLSRFSRYYLGESFGYSKGKTYNSGLGYNLGIYTFHCSALKNIITINPSIGLSLSEILYLNYSYALPISNLLENNTNALSRHQLHLIIRYNPSLISLLLHMVR
jgi:hypothetical protein